MSDQPNENQNQQGEGKQDFIAMIMDLLLRIARVAIPCIIIVMAYHYYILPTQLEQLPKPTKIMTFDIMGFQIEMRNQVYRGIITETQAIKKLDELTAHLKTYGKEVVILRTDAVISNGKEIDFQ